MEKLKIEIWGDVVCNFCFIGHEKLERVITKLDAKNKVEIICNSFQLDAEYPPQNESMPLSTYLSTKHGYTLEQIQSGYKELSSQGKVYNIDFQFNKALAFNTFDAHRLIQWAKESGKSSELKKAFLKAYYTDGIDLSRKENLLMVIGNIGLDVEIAKTILDNNSYAQEVRLDIHRASQIGINGVPYFLLNGEVVMTNDEKDFERVISEALLKLTSKQNTTENASICIPNEGCN